MSWHTDDAHENASARPFPIYASQRSRRLLTVDHLWIRYSNGSADDSGTYTLTKVASTLNGETITVLEFGPGDIKRRVSFSGSDTLHLDDEYYDGYEDIYVRK